MRCCDTIFNYGIKWNKKESHNYCYCWKDREYNLLKVKDNFWIALFGSLLPRWRVGVVIIMGISFISLYTVGCVKKYIYRYFHICAFRSVFGCVYVLAHAGSVWTRPTSFSFTTQQHYQYYIFPCILHSIFYSRDSIFIVTMTILSVILTVIEPSWFRIYIKYIFRIYNI